MSGCWAGPQISPVDLGAASPSAEIPFSATAREQAAELPCAEWAPDATSPHAMAAKAARLRADSVEASSSSPAAQVPIGQAQVESVAAPAESVPVHCGFRGLFAGQLVLVDSHPARDRSPYADPDDWSAELQLSPA